MKIRKTLTILSVLSMLFCASASYATTYTIPSDGTWKSYNQIQTGWNLLDYDDSYWRNAVEYCNFVR